MSNLSRRRVVIAAGAAAGTLAAPAFMSNARAAEFTIKYGNQVPESHPVTVAARRASARIREESKGQVDVQIFANNQLGSDTDMLSQVRTGALELFSTSALVLATLVPVTSVSGLGFAFKSYDDVWSAMDGELGVFVRNEIRKFGLTPMEKMWDSGYRQITTSTKPINSAEDLKNFKIRVPVSPLWTSLFKAFGASPASINFSEVYVALQTKVVDGQETPLVSIQAAKIYEVQKFCSMTNHMWDGYWIVANTRALSRLPADLQALVARNFNAAALEQRIENRKLNDSLQSQLAAAGLKFNTPETGSFRSALTKAGFYSEWKEKLGSDAWRLLEKYAGKLA